MAAALYRKYRPKSFKDLVGQDTTVEILSNAAKQDRLAHAYLFFGARGTGKTTAARLIAKIANCEKRHKEPAFKKIGEPCNECRVCAEIDNGHAMDVVEIDAASNRGIDEMRNLQEEVRLSPTSYPHKVFIIDEAHMLTNAAFNALLKTLEEPPAHAIFILATTEYDKISPTIASRTQRFIFKRLHKNKILEKLSSIVAQEKIGIEKDALELIAAAGDGSLRDAESLLDQVLAFAPTGGKGISLENVERVVGKVGLIRMDELVTHVFNKDISKTLGYLTEISNGGYNIPQFTKDLINYLRRILTLRVSPDIEELFKNDLTTEELKRIKTHAANAHELFTIKLIKSLIRAYGEIRYSPFAAIPLEVAFMENLRELS